MDGKNYWLHRVSHEGGIGILREEHRLTIGFSGVAASDTARTALERKDYGAFCSAYSAVYGGEIERLKNGLWRFVLEMGIGDLVVVPYPYGFYICLVKSNAVVCDRDLDLGWEREVEILADCSPRSSYASTALLSRMKCQQTNLHINDLGDDVEEALDMKRKNAPFDLVGSIGAELRNTLEKHCSPDKFEELVATYFRSFGAQVSIPSKNYSGKQGDCDVEAVFPTLKLTISAQCKMHVGTTDDWAVRQILDYATKRNESEKDDNWTYVPWVVSFAEKFSDEALKLAKENGVTLVNGEEFCRMLLNAGVR